MQLITSSLLVKTRSSRVCVCPFLCLARFSFRCIRQASLVVLLQLALIHFSFADSYFPVNHWVVKISQNDKGDVSIFAVVRIALFSSSLFPCVPFGLRYIKSMLIVSPLSLLHVTQVLFKVWGNLDFRWTQLSLYVVTYTSSPWLHPMEDFIAWDVNFTFPQFITFFSVSSQLPLFSLCYVV